MELGFTEPGDLRSSRLTMHVNKVHHVTTIDRVAKDLGEDSVLAFTDFGIENLIELVRFYKQNPRLLRR